VPQPSVPEVALYAQHQHAAQGLLAAHGMAALSWLSLAYTGRTAFESIFPERLVLNRDLVFLAYADLPDPGDPGHDVLTSGSVQNPGGHTDVSLVDWRPRGDLWVVHDLWSYCCLSRRKNTGAHRRWKHPRARHRTSVPASAG